MPDDYYRNPKIYQRPAQFEAEHRRQSIADAAYKASQAIAEAALVARMEASQAEYVRRRTVAKAAGDVHREMSQRVQAKAIEHAAGWRRDDREAGL